MSEAYEFLKECGSFFVLSINGEYPAGRPFGAVMEVGEDLYLSTNDMNQAHKQMRENEHIQIVAKKPTSREWIRVTGLAAECDDKDLKQRMLEECPILQQRFGAVGMELCLSIRNCIKRAPKSTVPGQHRFGFEKPCFCSL